MTKYNNPYLAIKEAMRILESRGVKLGATIQEEILSINVYSQYEGFERYYVVSIHVHSDRASFVDFVGAEDVAEIKHEPHSDIYDKISYVVSPGLEVFTLVLKETTK